MAQIPHLVSQPAGVPEPADRRGAVRYLSSTTTVCRLGHPRGGRALAAVARDVSTTGISFYARRRFPPGTFLALRLSNPARRFSCRLLVRVVHSNIELPNKSWLHGAVFTRQLSDRELLGLLP